MKMRQSTPKRAGLLVVRRGPGARHRGLLRAGGHVFACALGRGGVRALKREGDGATPAASMRLLYGYLGRPRAGQPALRSALPLKPARGRDGWCDAPDDRNYNRPVRLPYRASAERMARDDRLYDVCIVLDYNLRRRGRGRGSAIFLHIAKEGFAPTEGCVAVAPRVMARLLALAGARTRLVVMP